MSWLARDDRSSVNGHPVRDFCVRDSDDPVSYREFRRAFVHDGAYEGAGEVDIERRPMGDVHSDIECAEDRERRMSDLAIVIHPVLTSLEERLGGRR